MASEIIGLKELQANFRAFSVKAENNLEKTILKSCLLISNSAKKLFRSRDEKSEKGLPPRSQTGLLRASITHRLKRTEKGLIVGEVGTNVEYAKKVEFGTSETWPHPFMGPAYQDNLPDISAAITKAMKEATK